MSETENGSGTLVLKYWHIIIVLAALLTMGAKMIQSVDDLTRRVGALESNKIVTRDEFDAWRREFRDSLNRIEVEVLERNRMENRLR